MRLAGRLARLERRRGAGRPGYPPPVFSDEHLAESIGILAEAMGAEAALAMLAGQIAGQVPAEIEALVRGRGGRRHAVA